MWLHRRCAVLTFALASAASAATFSGAPQYTASPPGPALVFDQGRYGAWLLPTDDPGALVLVDGTDPESPGRELAVVSFELHRTGGFGSPPVRDVAFEPAGWTESVALGEATMTIRVAALADGAFGLFVSPSPDLNLTVRVRPPSGEAGAAGIEASVPAWEGEEWGFALAGPGAPQTDADGIALSLEEPLPEDLALVVAVGADADASRAMAAQALADSGEPSRWLDARRQHLADAFAAWSPLHDPTPERQALDDAALAQLITNRTPAGALPNKTHQGTYWLWDSTFQALAFSERSAEDALSLLQVHLGSRVTDEDSPHHGLIFGQVDDQGAAIAPEDSRAVNAYTQLAPLGLVLRALQDRAGAPPEDLETLLRAAEDYVEWYARRRDRDGDFRYELNGAIEHPHPDSKRFSKAWTEPKDVYPPLPEDSTRVALNAVDVTAWTGNLAIEAARLGERLGSPNAARMRERGTTIGGRLEEETEGFWFPNPEGFFDYVRTGANHDRELASDVRTPASWSPISAGIARDPVHIRSSVRLHATEVSFATPHGTALAVGGPVSVADTWLTIRGLFLYGYEEDARALQGALLDLLASSPNLHARYTHDGQALGPGGSGVAAAVAVLALRDRHQEETFDLQDGAVAKERQGYLRRMFRLGDGRLLLEIAVEGTSELPLTTLRSDPQLFSDAPMTLAFADPDGLIGDRTITVSLPQVAEAELQGPGGESLTFRQPADGAPVTFEARAGEVWTLRILRFSGERAGCGCASAGEAGLLWALGVALALAGRARRCRSVRA